MRTAGLVIIFAALAMLPVSSSAAPSGGTPAPTRAKAAPKSSPSLENLCELAAEQQRDLQELQMEQGGECGGSPMSPDAMPCFQAYSNEMMRVQSRYQARMARFREKAEKDLGRKVKDSDCCVALPSRYKAYGKNCYPFR